MVMTFSMTASFDRVLETSATVALFRRAEGVMAQSQLAVGASCLANTARQSFLYRWLTREPEPEVIVIDLRETYVVGPIISILNRIIDGLLPSWRNSLAKRVTTHLDTVQEVVARSITGRFIAILVAPPGPPEER